MDKRQRLINILSKLVETNIEIMAFSKTMTKDTKSIEICDKTIRDSKRALRNLNNIKHVDILYSLYKTLLSNNVPLFITATGLLNHKNVKRWDNTKKGYEEFLALEKEANEIAKEKAKEQAEKKKKFEEAKARGDKVEMLYNPKTKKIEPIITKKESGENEA